MTTRAEEFFDEYDYRDFVNIKVDGVCAFDVHDGEAEDNNMGRNFNDCYSVVNLMQMAWQAGKDGKPFEFIQKESEYA